MCGGTVLIQSDAHAGRGLSPRVRGNRHRKGETPFHPGSIPACAGEPVPSFWVIRPVWVYPRVCGGTRYHPDPPKSQNGLSPRVRGNLPPLFALFALRRSIPACAGEPLYLGTAAPAWRVYPRVCGGTSEGALFHRMEKGLSPRVRGNRVRIFLDPPYLRSIPACAGEPHRARPHTSPPEVYPRVCGGTSRIGIMQRNGMGLSPRVRGNPHQDESTFSTIRSIPACAGEPGGPIGRLAVRRVYPRVCGGTAEERTDLVLRGGLSPRVRGNRQNDRLRRSSGWSIPACAGEPGDGRPDATARGVYPRVCGGTGPDVNQRAFRQGLSPRVRGNRGCK